MGAWGRERASGATGYRFKGARCALGTTLELRRRMVDRAHWLPLGYVLDVLDPEVVILRREDGSMVGHSAPRDLPQRASDMRHNETYVSSRMHPVGEVPLARQRCRRGASMRR